MQHDVLLLLPLHNPPNIDVRSLVCMGGEMRQWLTIWHSIARQAFGNYIYGSTIIWSLYATVLLKILHPVILQFLTISEHCMLEMIFVHFFICITNNHLPVVFLSIN